MAQSYSVTAVLSAVDKNFTSTMGRAQSALGGMQNMLGSGLSFGVFSAIGTKAVNGVTGAMGGLIRTSWDAGTSFTESMSNVAAISGATGAQLASLEEKAKQMGSTTAFTASQAADAMSYMAMAGWKTEYILNGLDGIMNLAAASGEDLAATSDIVTDALTAFGKTADDSGHLADIMAAASANANTNVSMMGETFKYVAPVAGSLGYSMEDTSVAIGLMANSGIKGSQAGTTLRSMLTRLAKPTKEVQGAMNALGVSLTNEKGEMKSMRELTGELRTAFSGLSEAEKAQYAASIAGQEGMSGLLAIVNASEEDVNKLTEAIDNSSGAAQKMAATKLDNLSGDITIAKSAFEGLGLTIFDTIEGPVRSFVNILTSGIAAVNNALQNIDMGPLKWMIGTWRRNEDGVLTFNGSVLAAAEKIKGLKSAAAGMGAVLAGAFVMKGGGLKALTSLPGIFAGIESAGAGAFSTLSAKASTAMSKIASLRIDPGKIAGSLDGLGGAIAGKLEAISPRLSDAGLKIWEGFEQAGAKVQSATGAIGKGFDFIVQKAGPVGQVFSGVGKGIKTSANAGVKSLSYMTSALGTVMKVALAAVGPAAILGLALAGMGLVYSQFGDQIDSIISMVKTRGPDIIGGLVRGITSRIPALAASGARMLSGIMGAITANIPAIFQGGVSIISTLAGAVTANLPVLIPAAVRMVTTLINSIVSSIPQILMTGLQLLLGLAQGLTNNSGLITSSATGIINNLVTSFTGNLPQILQTGVQILMALAQGAVNTLPQLIIAGIQGITMFISSVSQNLPMILQAGVSIVQTLLSGLVQNLPGILQAAVEMISALAQGILTNLPQIIIAGAQIIVSLVTGLIQMLPTILQAGWNLIVSLGQGIVEAVPQIITAAVEGIKGIFTDLWSFITGKNTEGNEAMTASTATTTANVSATYAGMSSTVTADTESMTSDLMKEYSKVESGASSAFSGMESSVTGSTSAIESAGTGDFSALQAGVTSASEGMQSSVDTSMKQMTSSARSGMSGFNSALSSGSTRARATAQQMAKGVVTAAKSAASGMKSAGSSAGQGFVNGVSSKRSAASGAGSSVASAATNAMSGRSGTAYSHGANIGQGLANGIWSKVGAVRAAADALVAQANRAIAAKARLGSPSKITTQYGKWYGEGWINGIIDMVSDAGKAAAKLFSVPEAKVPAVGFAGSGALSSEYDYSGSIHTTTVVTVDLDGREIARTTVPYTEELLDKREKRANRKKGVA